MENKKINWEEISMTIITHAGTAKSLSMEALQEAKSNNFEEANKMMAEAEKEISIASHSHFEVVMAEANGSQLDFKVLFLHAEDQLLTTQTLMLMVQEFIELYQKIGK